MVQVMLYLHITVPFRLHTAGLPFIVFKCFIKRSQCVIWHVDSSLWWCLVHRCLALAWAVARVRGKGLAHWSRGKISDMMFLQGCYARFYKWFNAATLFVMNEIKCLWFQNHCLSVLWRLSWHNWDDLQIPYSEHSPWVWYARARNEPFNMNAFVVLFTWSVFCRTGLTAGFHPFV